MMSMRESWVGFVIFALLACGRGQGGAQTAVSDAPPPPKVVQVTTTSALQAEVPRFTTLTGSVVADQKSDVAADVSGKILSVPVERGASVKAGAVLALLDRRSANLSSREAAADAELASIQSELAKLDCARADWLFQTGALGRSEYEQSKARCKGATLALQAAQTRQEGALKVLGDAVIRAPFAGVISERFVNVGEYVRPESRIVTLVSSDPVRVQILVPEQLVGRVAVGMPMEVSVSAYPGESFAGTVRYMGAALRELTRDLVVEATVPNADLKLRPGMFAVVRLHLPKVLGVVVPMSSVRNDGSVSRLFVVHEGRIEERVVETGVREGERLEIVRGVAAGEQVVSKWAPELEDGARVGS
jgi:membrane fusion protein, multidrug efflux system